MRSITVGCLAALLFTLPAAGAQEPPIELDELIVTASRVPRPVEEIPTHVTVLSGQALREAGVTHVLDALRALPGIHVAPTGSFGSLTSLFMRGGESDYVLVMIDGVQLNRPGGAIDLSSLTTENIERIEVVRGPLSALYGSDAVAGVIQIITRTGQGSGRAATSVRAGSYGRVDWTAELSGGDEGIAYGFSASRMKSDGILPFNNQHLATTVTGTLQLELDAATSLRVTGRYSDRGFNFPTDFAGNPVDLNSRSFGQELAISAEATRSVSDRVELKALLTTFEVDGGTDDAQDSPADTLGFFAFSSIEDVRRNVVDLRGNVVIAEGSLLTLGWELEQEAERTFNESMSQFGPSSGHSENERWNRGYYAQLVSEFGPASTNAGVRVENNGRFGTFTSYRLGSSVALPGAARVRASLGRAIKEPTFFENYATGFTLGNPALEPEQSLAWEIGAEQQVAGGRGRMSITYFDQAFRDLIQYTFVPVDPRSGNFVNVAEADARGIEAVVEGRVVETNVSVGYTHLRTEVVDAGVDEGPGATFVEGEALIRRPKHALRLSLSRTFASRGSVSLQWTKIGEREDRDFSAFPAAPVRLIGYDRLDIGTDLVLTRSAPGRPGVSLMLRAENLLGEEYQEVLGFVAPGRGLYAGVRLSFGG